MGVLWDGVVLDCPESQALPNRDAAGNIIDKAVWPPGSPHAGIFLCKILMSSQMAPQKMTNTLRFRGFL